MGESPLSRGYYLHVLDAPSFLDGYGRVVIAKTIEYVVKRFGYRLGYQDSSQGVNHGSSQVNDRFQFIHSKLLPKTLHCQAAALRVSMEVFSRRFLLTYQQLPPF